VRVFFDSSAFVKRFVQEVGSDQIDGICMQASTVGLSIICFPEMLSALNRKVRENVLDKAGYMLLKQAITEDIQDTEIVNVDAGVMRNTIRLLEQNTLRSLDAIHIASAIEWNAELFVSADKRQIQAAENGGLAVHFV
jgi:predicted nucleic acid-binding protein